MSDKHSDSRDREIQQLLRQALSRRRFLTNSALAAGGLAVGGSLLAACGGKEAGGGEAAGGAAGGGGGSGGAVRISNWPLYIDPQTVPDFEKATGIKVEYNEDVNDNNEFFAKIDEPLKRNQSIDRDIVVLTDWMIGRLISLGYAAQLDDSKFANKANLVDNLKDVSFDPGRKYSVPWVSGMAGLGYNPKKTGRELTSINDIFDPKFKGQVTMLTEMRDTLGLVMLALGKDPSKATKADAEAACARIKKARESGQIRKFTGNDYAEDLAAGNIAIAFAWSGDIQGLAADNPELRWVAPKEGAMLYSDNMLIPKTSDRQAQALAFMNYVYEPAHSAQIIKEAPYISPVKGAGEELAKIAPDLAKSPLVNPPDDLRARLRVFKSLSDTEDTEFNRLFQDAIGA
jgi:spermidine/putrescine transport system substrate-binding protein